MSMTPGIIERLAQTHAQDLRRAAISHTATGAGRGSRRLLQSSGSPSRWVGRLLMRAGARLAGLPAPVRAPGSDGALIALPRPGSPRPLNPDCC